MAPPAGTLRVGRYFLALLALFVLLAAIVFWPSSSHTPKLGLDLRGGAQIVYQAQTTTGKTPSASSMNQAKTIIDQRVNGLGVEQSTVVIQGSDQIVVTVPGKRADQLDDVGKTALLNFRPLVAGPFTVTAPVTPTTTTSGSATTSPSSTATSANSATNSAGNTGSAGSSSTPPVSGQNAGAKRLAEKPLAAASTTPPAAATATATPTATPTGSAPAGGSATPSSTVAATPTITADATTLGFGTLTAAQKLEIQNYRCADAAKEDAQKNIAVCDNTGAQKYLLGPVLVPGTQVDTAAANAPNASSGTFAWSVMIELRSSGQATWAEYTSKHHNPDPNGQTTDTTPANYVAFTLDDQVISNTNILSTINGNTQVTGNFTQTQATQLANSLKYGALPLKFTKLATSTVSATLGTVQLKAGLLAGGIGLLLVVIYSLLYYRALGLVTIASLLVSGGLTYLSLVVLGGQIGFTLTLAGIAGFIVAVGITADSFVVLFERIKDEVHEGRTMRVAVPRAWIRARRTIISADVVSFLAAFVLYLFAAGDVRGFAFTLGMSTILDLVVVFLFTHPLVSLLSRSAAFGSARFTGLDSARTGGVAQAAPTAEARRRASAKRKATAVIGRATGSGGTATSVLDDDRYDAYRDDADTDIAPDDGDDLRVDWTEDDVTDDVTGDRDAAADMPPPAATGSAAERAAARRAKLREEGKR